MVTYEIVIKNQTAKKMPKAVSGGNNGGSSVGGEMSSGESKLASYVGKLAARVVSVQALVSTVDQGLSHYYSTRSIVTGTQEESARLNFAYQKISGAAKSIGFGALAGSAAGPVGAAIGAAFAAVTYAANEGINYLKKQDILQKENDLESISRRMQMMRATVSGRRYTNVTEM